MKVAVIVSKHSYGQRELNLSVTDNPDEPNVVELLYVVSMSIIV